MNVFNGKSQETSVFTCMFFQIPTAPECRPQPPSGGGSHRHSDLLQEQRLGSVDTGRWHHHPELWVRRVIGSDVINVTSSKESEDLSDEKWLCPKKNNQEFVMLVWCNLTTTSCKNIFHCFVTNSIFAHFYPLTQLYVQPWICSRNFWSGNNELTVNSFHHT